MHPLVDVTGLSVQLRGVPQPDARQAASLAYAPPEPLTGVHALFTQSYVVDTGGATGVAEVDACSPYPGHELFFADTAN